jgi:hypothetical protein
MPSSRWARGSGRVGRALLGGFRREIFGGVGRNDCQGADSNDFDFASIGKVVKRGAANAELLTPCVYAPAGLFVGAAFSLLGYRLM